MGNRILHRPTEARSKVNRRAERRVQTFDAILWTQSRKTEHSRTRKTLDLPERTHRMHETDAAPYRFDTTGSKHPTPLIRKRYAVPRGEIGDISLSRIGEHQRLTVDHGADRIEIGMLLREPEREWLAAVLHAWRDQPQSW